jgi:hypothetical protein
LLFCIIISSFLFFFLVFFFFFFSSFFSLFFFFLFLLLLASSSSFLHHHHHHHLLLFLFSFISSSKATKISYIYIAIINNAIMSKFLNLELLLNQIPGPRSLKVAIGTFTILSLSAIPVYNKANRSKEGAKGQGIFDQEKPSSIEASEDLQRKKQREAGGEIVFDKAK